ncbi:transcription factor SPEECHLESS [Neltuma alba]|uniref:transcription factor SPEECHLESS n=1 Tax=Neltuma alba TaxID=207710 RepID=UPI0010A52AC6|nr:transcription factor SPEECHLESS [Prosopis alba]
MDDSFSDILEDKEFGGDELFAILESLEDFSDFPPVDEVVISTKENEETSRFASQKSSSSSALRESEETELEASPKSKRQKLAPNTSSEDPNPDGQQRTSHITVERNRRKQMNEHLSVLRSLMPNFYVKRGDQASIIGGVVDYINELQQVLQSLEAKKQRKVYSDVLSPRLVSSPRPLALSPRKPPMSPRLSLPISPRTPQPGSPYKPRLQQGYLSPTISNSLEPSPTSSAASSSINDNINELVANSKSAMADVEVKFSGPHVLLKTVSPRIPGQALKIISALEDLSLEILHVSISTADETMLNSFTIKIGIECQLSAEELALQIQQTFC